MTKRKKNIEIYRVDRELYPDSPLLEVGEVWYHLDGHWLDTTLNPQRVEIFKDHLYLSHREPALKHVQDEIAIVEKELNKAMAKYHKRLWYLASLLMEDMD